MEERKEEEIDKIEGNTGDITKTADEIAKPEDLMTETSD